MTCCRYQAGLSPAEGAEAGSGLQNASREEKGQEQVPTQTFVIVPHTDLPHTAQAVRGGNLKDVQTIAVKGSVPIQVPVATPAICPIQHDAHMCRGAWRVEGEVV